jgi:hypothetical protein
MLVALVMPVARLCGHDEGLASDGRVHHRLVSGHRH